MKNSNKVRRFFTMDRHHAGGFTLVELVVVIAILAILAGVAIPAYSGYVEKANKRLTINRNNPKVTQEGGKFVARFTEIDTSSVTAEVRPSKSAHFQYVARLRYHEMTYESEGKTRKAALKGPWKCVNVRRLTEMPRYAKGKWEN